MLFRDAKKNRNESESHGTALEVREKKTFADQFKSAQEYFEWSLEEAWKWMDRHPHKEIKGYVDF